jgi:hypothetical protein
MTADGEVEVTIETEFVLLGRGSSGPAAGGFTSSGAIIDRGKSSGEYRFAGPDDPQAAEPRPVTSTEVLEGRDGTLALQLVGVYGALVEGRMRGSGHWVVTRGTGAYEGMQGTGTWTAESDFRRTLEGQGSPVARATYIGAVRWGSD